MAGPLPTRLLPDSATTSASGSLRIGGVDVVDLAAEHGTPLFVYDEAHLRDRCREAVAGFGGEVAYASKAFLCKEMARLVHEEGMVIDVSSRGEYHVARVAGVPAERIVLHGNNKSIAELSVALDERVHRVVVDSFDEIDRIERLVAAGAPPPRALVRITPGVEAHTHSYVQTGQQDSKFGFGVAHGAAAEAVERCRSSSAVDLVGLHVHIGSQIFRLDSYEKALSVVAEFASPLGLAELSVGGGLGVAYVEGEEAPTITEWAELVHRAVDSLGMDVVLSAEPGRSIAAGAAVTVYEIGTIKTIPGIRNYVSVDGGMSDNPRPVLYGSGYETFLPRAVEEERPLEVTVVGKHCESGDVIVAEGHVPADTRVGDLLATPVTGAYGLSMGSNYNRVPRPAAVFVSDGSARLVVRRESLDDLLRLDC